jgi:hypothetical protein
MLGSSTIGDTAAGPSGVAAGDADAGAAGDDAAAGEECVGLVR